MAKQEIEWVPAQKYEKLQAELEDIRVQLHGLPESQLGGKNGLAAATRRAADACSEMADELSPDVKTQRDLPGAVRRIVAENQRLREAAKPFVEDVDEEENPFLAGDDDVECCYIRVTMKDLNALAEAMNPGDKEPK